MNELIEMLRRHEGVRDKVYLCSAGYETIGVGRNISEDGLGLSEDEIDYLLNNDIKRVREELTEEYNTCYLSNAADADYRRELEVGDIIWQVQNLHVYERHFHLVK